jgi:membrane protein DedA with SNARE-associated domain
MMLMDLIGHFTCPGVFLILFATGLGVPVPEELPIAIAAMMARWEAMHWWGALLSCLGVSWRVACCSTRSASTSVVACSIGWRRRVS